MISIHNQNKQSAEKKIKKLARARSSAAQAAPLSSGSSAANDVGERYSGILNGCAIARSTDRPPTDASAATEPTRPAIYMYSCQEAKRGPPRCLWRLALACELVKSK